MLPLSFEQLPFIIVFRVVGRSIISYLKGERQPMKIRTDSKSIALLAIFSSIVIALEIFPIPGITDLYTPIPHFTIDWTGIPIVIIFFGLGIVYSFFSVAIMWISIAYRNFSGAVFKALAESFTLLGIVVVKFALRKRKIDWKYEVILYTTSAMIFRAIGMLFGNAILFQLWSYTSSPEAAFALSMIYVPWNLLQAVINVFGGMFLYKLIPENLKIEAGLGHNGDKDKQRYEELSSEEIESTDDE